MAKQQALGKRRKTWADEAWELCTSQTSPHRAAVCCTRVTL